MIDAKTGVSGAGKQPTETTHFVAVTENVRPYGVGAHRHMPEIDQELAALGAPVPIAFTPHLLPLDQGELLSCYVTPTRPLSQAALEELYADRYGEEPFIELVTRPPGVRDVRETNVCAMQRPRRRAHRQALRVRGDRQPVEGDRLAGRRQPQPDVRLRRGDGPAVTDDFFTSRWVAAARVRP